MIDKALTEFLYLAIARCLLVHQLNILTAADLTFLCDSLAVLESPNLMIVHIAVIFTRLSDECFRVRGRLHQKVLFNLEYLFFVAFRQVDIKSARTGNKQKLLVIRLSGRQANHAESVVDYATHFVLEVFAG